MTLTKNIGEGGVMVNQTSDEGQLGRVVLFQRRIAEKLPLAMSAATASMSGASGRSSVTLLDLARTTAYAFLARVLVCSGASKSIPWHAHSNSIAIVCRKLTSMRSSRRAPLIPMDT